MIGPAGGDGEESFDLTVCTPDWFRDHRMGHGMIMGSHTLFVAKYDYPAIKRFLERAAQRVEADNWPALAQCLSCLGHWEFADFQAASAGQSDGDVGS